MFTATIQDLTAALPALNDRDRTFATDLLNAWNRYGHLTERQSPYVDRLVARAKAATSGAPVDAGRETVQVGDFSGMVALFDQAAKTLKRPAIALYDETVGEIRITVAGPTARNPGTLNVSTPGGYGNSTWFGRVLRDGRFEKSPRDASPVSLVALLTRFAEKPAETALAFARLKGRCAFCNGALADERSTALGYGATCAKRWGMPWSVGAARAASPVVAAAPRRLPRPAADLFEAA